MQPLQTYHAYYTKQKHIKHLNHEGSSKMVMHFSAMYEG